MSRLPLSPAIWYYLTTNGGMKWGMGESFARLSRTPKRGSAMARIGKLSAVEVAKAKGPAVLHDGGGLYLRFSSSGGKSWVFRFQLDGKRSGLPSRRAAPSASAPSSSSKRTGWAG